MQLSFGDAPHLYIVCFCLSIGTGNKAAFITELRFVTIGKRHDINSVAQHFRLSPFDLLNICKIRWFSIRKSFSQIPDLFVLVLLYHFYSVGQSTCSWYFIYFNLTHPLRDATSIGNKAAFKRAISILRIPCGMQPILTPVSLANSWFQSYASLTECNELCYIPVTDVGNFNLTPPLRDATVWEIKLRS